MRGQLCEENKVSNACADINNRGSIEGEREAVDIEKLCLYYRLENIIPRYMEGVTVPEANL
jgi:hypothetical protein